MGGDNLASSIDAVGVVPGAVASLREPWRRMVMPDLGINLVAMFERSAARRGEGPFLWYKSAGTYRPWSWQRAGSEARLLARWLAARGVAPARSNAAR